MFVTHADHDHVGALGRRSPKLQRDRRDGLLAFGLMSMGSEPIPPERAFIVHDGSAVTSVTARSKPFASAVRQPRNARRLRPEAEHPVQRGLLRRASARRSGAGRRRRGIPDEELVPAQ